MKRSYENNNMMSPSPKSTLMSPQSRNVLEQQINQLQLLSQQELVDRLKSKKQMIMRQNTEIAQNCHRYFMELTNILIEVENSIKKSIDAQTLEFLEEIERKIDQVRENQHSYNCNSEAYSTLKLLIKNYTETQESLTEVKKMISKCYSVSLQGFTQQCSQIQMATDNKIYISGSEFITTNKKTHGSILEVTERQFELALSKFEEREEKQMLVNERLKNKVKSLEEMLSKKGLNIKELNRMTSAQNQKVSQDYWDLELERVKAENAILTEEITQISNKLIGLTSQNQALKGQYKKMLQSNLSQISNQNNTLNEGVAILEEHSRLEHNFIPSQTMISNTVRDIRQEQATSGIFIQSSLFQNNIHHEMLVEYEKRTEHLSAELTKRLREIQELREEIQKKEKQVQETKKQGEQKSNHLQRLSNELERLSHHSERLEHDYEVSSKKRFELEEKITLLKQELKESKEKENYANIQAKLEKDNLQSLLKLKEENLKTVAQQLEAKIKQEYEQKITDVNNQNSQLLKEIDKLKAAISQSKLQAQGQASRFKEQFKRLQQNISSKDQQLATLMDQLYQVNKTQKQTEEENSQTFKEKYQANKKEISKVKKELKDKTKEYETLKIQFDKINELLQLKSIQIQQQIQVIFKDLEKVKSSYEIKLRILEDKAKVIKEKHQLNLTEFIAQYSGTQAKKGILIELVEKYSDSMSNFAQKTAEIKKLKQEIKELKAAKTNNNIKNTKRQLSKDVQSVKKFLQTNQQELTEIQISIRQDRAKIEKSILEEKITILEEEKLLLSKNLQAKEKQIKSIQEETQKLRKQVKICDETTKRQYTEQNLKSQIKSLQNKVEKLQSQLKSTKILHKKSVEQLNTAQTELKKKKDHISNVKKELTSNSDQLEEMNFLLKNKNQEIEKLKRQLKDQSTKESLLNQMKEKMETYQELQSINEELKKQVEKIASSSKFEINKLTNEIKQLKAQKREEINQKVSSKTKQLNEEINDLKVKNKKLKTELERKESLIQHTKTKNDGEIVELRNELQETGKELEKKMKECQSYERKLEIASVNQRKYKQKAKLLSVVIEKIYTKMLTQRSRSNSKYHFNKQNTLLQNTSPISQAFASNLFGSNLFTNNTTVSPSITKQKQNSTLQTFKHLDIINLDDLEKYSEGLEMFGVNAGQLKSLQKDYGIGQNERFENEASTISYLMQSPENHKSETIKIKSYGNRGGKEDKDDNHIKTGVSAQVKEKVQKLSDCLEGRQEIDVGQIVSFFEQIIEETF